MSGDQVTVSVTVPADPPSAFAIFTEETDLWWRHGPRFRIAGRQPGVLLFEPRTGGRLLERFADREFDRGRITVWEPPSRFAFEWRAVNFAPDESTLVEVRFEQVPTGTRVTVRHSGWSRLRADHPVRHRLAGADFLRMMGLWWGDLCTSFRERISYSTVEGMSARTAYLATHRDRFLEELKTFLRIPSVSTDPSHRGDVAAAAEFVAADLRRSGLEHVEVVTAEGRHPLVYADWLHAKGKPTLLLYGHFDVQPPDPLNEWTSPPFEPAIRGEDIFARGASDDKGQTLILMKALEAMMKTGDGRLPINVRVLIEGEEEVGGKHIERFVTANHDRLLADAALICDTELFAPDLPTICTGLRGIVYGELIVEGARTDLHSGVYGGAAPNAVMAAAEIVTALKDRDGRIRVPGLLDKVRPPSPEERAAWESLPFDEAAYLEKEIGASELVGEPGIPVLERVWARPTLEVHGIRGGFTGEGAKTVIPARAVVKLSMRLVADQDPVEATRQLQAAVAAACPRGVKARFESIQGGPPSLIDPSSPYIRAAATALDRVFGKKTVYMRSGGSIPIVGLFQRELKIPSVLMGFGLPDDNLHAPNEKFHLPNFFRGIRTVSDYFEVLSESQYDLVRQ